MKTYSLLFVLSLILSLNAISQPLTPIIDSIPMRDGKKLVCDIYLPAGGIQRPTILIQTPYYRYWYRFGLPLDFGINPDSSPYNFVIVDWRGFYGSAAAANPDALRGEDGYDCVEWIAAQSWSDGKIGTWGPSALGKIQFQTAKEQPEHLVCCCPLVAGSQFDYQEYYPGGVYRKEYVDQLDALGYGMSVGLLTNPFYNFVWQYVENSNWYPDQISVPVLMIGGWYDHNVKLMLSLFEGIQQESPSPVNSEHKLLMGPWVHGGHGASYVGSDLQGELSYPQAMGWSDSLALRFFDYYLLNALNEWPDEPVIRYFQMGDNFWEATDVWPPEGTSNVRFYLHQDELLHIYEPDDDFSATSFLYDPSNPSPTHGGPTLREDMLQGPYNQSEIVETRDDVIIFTSPPFTEDGIMKGNPLVKLFVSSDCLDTDFAVRLTDVYPDGRSMLLLDGIQRMRFREGYSTSDTASMNSGTVYEIEIELFGTAITFKEGHKLRLDISSSNYPRFDNNLNNGGNMYVSGDTIIANNSVFHQIGSASYIELPMISYALGEGEEIANNNNNYILFPNPCRGKFSIIEESGRKIESVEIETLTGQKVFFSSISDSNKEIAILPANLSPGIYLVRINNEIEKKLIICQ